jgi:hypothetical protein
MQFVGSLWSFDLKVERKSTNRRPSRAAFIPSAAVPTSQDRENTQGYMSPVGATQSLPFQQFPQSSSNSDEMP